MVVDPLSVSGLALGAISLSAQVLKGCLQAFEIFQGAVDLPQDCAGLSLRLEIEYGRLKNWSQVAGLLDFQDESKVCGTIRANRLLLAAILTEIQTSMTSFAELNGQYIELHSNRGIGVFKDSGGKSKDGVTRADLVAELGALNSPYGQNAPMAKKGVLAGVSAVFRDTGTVIRHPKTLKWALMSRDRFEKLLGRLQELIDYLHELMDDQQMEVLHKTTQKTYLEMLQLRSTVEELKELMDAVKPLNQFTVNMQVVIPNNQIRDEEKGELLKLAAFKSSSFALSKNTTSGGIKVKEILTSSLTFESSKFAGGRADAIYHTGGTPQRVWVEWKELKVYENEQISDQQALLGRIKELSALLALDKPKEFCAPTCLGYIDARQDAAAVGRFGMVFAVPRDLDVKDSPVSITQAIKETSMPSLNKRVALASKIASCLFYLHSVNWLHKGFRSENLIIFRDANKEFLTHLYLTGFEYARPARSGEATEAIPHVPAWEIYRHPNIQGGEMQSRRYYRKTYDIYSMGIVLIEVALWKSIDEAVGIANIEDASPQITYHVRDSLLNTNPQILETVRSHMGNKYHDAVKACITGGESFGISPGDDETTNRSGAILQDNFRKEVLDKLTSIAV
ncbi:prion-inhibition and propagation-domain-containing protein [Bisporella sp. PMI_857]|nr:prion-inhibition and propagation-domain-containing protein [Bisporella sp. PMI_857]